MDNKQLKKNGVTPKDWPVNVTSSVSQAYAPKPPDTSPQTTCVGYVHDRVQQRADYIVGSLFGQHPVVTVVAHNCPRPYYPFIASVEISYTSSLSPHDFLINGQFFTKTTGGEYFLYEPVPEQIIEHLRIIGVPKTALDLLTNGQAKIEWP